MNREKASDVILGLFSSFGKLKPDARQLAVYLDWAESYPEDVVRKAIELVIKEETKLPPVAVLYKAVKKGKSKVTHDHFPEDECYYCGGTGFVPVLYRPSKISAIPYTRNFACKCARGKSLRWLPNYFERFEKPQFSDRMAKYPGLNYPQVVYQIKKEFMEGVDVSSGVKKPVPKEKQNGQVRKGICSLNGKRPVLDSDKVDRDHLKFGDEWKRLNRGNDYEIQKVV